MCSFLLKLVRCCSFIEAKNATLVYSNAEIGPSNFDPSSLIENNVGLQLEYRKSQMHLKASIIFFFLSMRYREMLRDLHNRNIKNKLSYSFNDTLQSVFYLQ